MEVVNPMARNLMLLFVKLVINALALVVVEAMFHGIWVEPQSALRATIAAAILLALVNTYLRPLVIVLTLPLNILTLGLFTLVINALMLKLVSWLIPAFHVEGFWTAVGGAIVISIVSFLLNWFLNPKQVRVHVQRF
jgi:putative membrane protein